MNENENKEMFAFNKEAAEAAMNERMESVMESIIDEPSFSEEQRGQIKVWLKQLYELGKEHGAAMTVVDSMGEETIQKFVGCFEKVAEVTNPNNNEKDYRTESMFYRLMYDQERQVSDIYKMRIHMLQEKIDGTFGKVNALCFCNPARRE